MHKTVAYINFDGQCADAFQLYAEVLGGSVESLATFNDCLPHGNLPTAQARHVQNAVLHLDGLILIGCDRFSKAIHTDGHRLALSINMRCERQALNAFLAFAKDGVVMQSFQPTGASKGVGTVIDQFGILWTISSTPTPVTQVEDVQWST